MEYYDLTYLISPELNETGAQEFTQKLTAFLQEQGAVFDKSGGPNKLDLAYLIQKHPTAYLHWLTFFVKKEKIQATEKYLKEQKQILRFLLLRELPPGSRKERTARGPRKTEVKRDKVKLEDVEKKLEELLDKQT